MFLWKSYTQRENIYFNNDHLSCSLADCSTFKKTMYVIHKSYNYSFIKILA